MHAVTGAYAKPIFVDKLGASSVCLTSSIYFNNHNFLVLKFANVDIWHLHVGFHFKWSASWRFWAWSSRSQSHVSDTSCIDEICHLLPMDKSAVHFNLLHWTDMLRIWSKSCLARMPLILGLQVMVCWKLSEPDFYLIVFSIFIFSSLFSQVPCASYPSLYL